MLFVLFYFIGVYMQKLTVAVVCTAKILGFDESYKVLMFFIIKIRYFLAVYKKIPYLCIERFAVVAQLVERKLPKLQVAGSCPVYRSLFYPPLLCLFNSELEPNGGADVVA